MAHTVSRKEFIENLLATLGREFRSINVSPDQLEDIISDATDWFVERVPQYREPGKIIHTITATEASNGYITLPTSVYSVDEFVVSPVDMNGASWIGSRYGCPGASPITMFTGGLADRGFLHFGTNYNNYEGEFWSYGPAIDGTPIGRVLLDKTIFEFIRSAFRGSRYNLQYEYNKITKKLFSEVIYDNEGMTVTILVQHRFENLYSPTDSIPHYTNYYLFEDYCYFQTLASWYQNMATFGDIQLPDGRTIDFESKLASINEQIDKLKESIIEDYGFYYGQFIMQ